MDEDISAAAKLGQLIRDARKQRKLTIAALAEKIGRPREWLNRTELGYSEWGEHKPPSKPDLDSLIENLSPLRARAARLHELRDQADSEFQQFKTKPSSRMPAGKSVKTEIIMGEHQLYSAAAAMIESQYSDAVIRNTGIWNLAPAYLKKDQDWENYRKALGKFLSENPNGLLKRIEYVGSRQHLDASEESGRWLAGDKEITEVHNAKVRYLTRNPLLLDVVIGQREAIICLPQRAGRTGLIVGIIVRDKLFVDALKTWFDEVLWDHPVDKEDVDFEKFEESFSKISQMYGFKTKGSDE